MNKNGVSKDDVIQSFILMCEHGVESVGKNVIAIISYFLSIGAVSITYNVPYAECLWDFIPMTVFFILYTVWTIMEVVVVFLYYRYQNRSADDQFR